MIDHVTPTDERLAFTAARGADDDSPVVMLNLNRYRARAEYPAGTLDSDVTGREAYFRYGVVAFAAIQSVGGEILWATDAAETVIGCDHDVYDEVVAVWYPSRGAFLDLVSHPGYLEALAHRDAAIEQATLIATRGEATPLLTHAFARTSD